MFKKLYDWFKNSIIDIILYGGEHKRLRAFLKDFMETKNDRVRFYTSMELIPENDQKFILNLPYQDMFFIVCKIYISITNHSDSLCDMSICPHCIHHSFKCSQCSYALNNGTCGSTKTGRYQRILSRLRTRGICGICSIPHLTEDIRDLFEKHNIKDLVRGEKE